MSEVPPQLQKYVFKKGNKGGGRKPGKTLKEFAREYLASMKLTERIEFLNSVDSDLIWRMAEGNPPQQIEGNPDKPFIVQVESEIADKNGITSGTK